MKIHHQKCVTVFSAHYKWHSPRVFLKFLFSFSFFFYSVFFFKRWKLCRQNFTVIIYFISSLSSQLFIPISFLRHIFPHLSFENCYTKNITKSFFSPLLCSFSRKSRKDEKSTNTKSIYSRQSQRKWQNNEACLEKKRRIRAKKFHFIHKRTNVCFFLSFGEHMMVHV